MLETDLISNRIRLHRGHSSLKNETYKEGSKNVKLINRLCDIENKYNELKLSLKVEIRSNEMIMETLGEKTKCINSLQELLFENSKDIPEGLYIKLMDALIGKVS